MNNKSIEEKELGECTFKPEISAYAKKIELSDPVSQRTKQILEERERKLQSLRRQLEERQAHLTFKPSISKYTFKEPRPSFLENVEEQIQKRKEFQTLVEEEKQRKHQEEAPFVPSISIYSKHLDRGDEPIHERLFRLSKSMAINSSQDPPPLSNEATFHPQISTTPLKPREGKIEDRMYQDALEREEKRKDLMEKIEKHEKKLAQPKMNGASKHLIRSKVEKEIHSVFEQIDRNESGFISYKQLGEALQRLGLFKSGNSQRRTEQEIRIHERIWRVMDPEDSGMVDFHEFRRVIYAILDPASITDENDRVILRELSEEIKLLSLNKLAYSKSTSQETATLIQKARDKELTFKPVINQHSKNMDQTKLFQLQNQQYQQHQNQEQYVTLSSTGVPVSQEDSDTSSQTNSETSQRSERRPRTAWETGESIDTTVSLGSLSVNANSSAMTTPRYELLLKRQEEIAQRKERERNELRQKEMESCTFQPKINKKKSIDRRKKDGGVNHFMYLYSQKDKPKKFSTIMDTRNAEEKELQQFCTFQPDRSVTKKFDKVLLKKKKPESKADTNSNEDKGKASVTSTTFTTTTTTVSAVENSNSLVMDESIATNTNKTEQQLSPKAPRGYKEYVERLRRANEKEKFDYHNSLREGLKIETPENVDYKTKRTEFKPFSFQLDNKKHKPKPLLYMDVNMGPGRTGRIGIHEGDDPDILATNFSISYKLDPVLTRRLAELIRDSLAKNLPRTETRTEVPPAPQPTEEKVEKRKSKTPTPTRPTTSVETSRSKSTTRNRSAVPGASKGVQAKPKGLENVTKSDVQKSEKAPLKQKTIIEHASAKVNKFQQRTDDDVELDIEEQLEEEVSILDEEEEQQVVAVKSEQKVASTMAFQELSSTSTQTFSQETLVLLDQSPTPKRNVLESLKELKQFTESGNFKGE